MTLGNMRSQGIRSVSATCQRSGCGHMAEVSVETVSNEMPVPDVSLKLRCSKCVGRRIKTIPNLTERSTPRAGFSPFRG
jgi:hypothetical protein